MTKKICGALVAMLALFERVQAAPLEAYGRLPQYENVALSPDGEKAAFVTTIGDQREVIVQPLATKDGVIRLRAGAQKLRDINWAGTDQLLITVSQSSGYFGSEQSESFALQNFDLKRKSAFYPMTWTSETWNMLALDPLSRVIDGKAVVYIQSFTTPPLGKGFGIPAFYKANLKDQTTQLIDGAPASNPRHAYRWIVDSEGNEILQSLYDEEKKSWSLFTRKNNDWSKVYSEQTLIDTPYAIGLYHDNSHVLINKFESGKWVLRSFSVVDGKWGEPLPDKCCGSRYLADPTTNLIIGSASQDARRHYIFYDSSLQQQWDQVVQSFSGEEVTLASWSAGLKKIIVLVFGKTTGAAYFLIDMDTKQMSRLGDLYAGIGAADIAMVRPIAYDAADGLQVPGYLTLPQGKVAKNLPLVVMPHGGPAARDSMRFDWFAQALASRGYLVLQPNFRGSWGLDQKLEEAGYGEYGRKMQSDVSDGVRALVKLGIVDPQRVCIVGASYGGYAALMGAATEPDIYRCAVSIAGVSDLEKNFSKYVNVSVSPDSRGLRYMLRYTGATDLSDPVLPERSPAMHADNVKGPILLIHGEDDAVVSIEQSQIMADALKKAGKPYEFVKLKSEDHWLSKADTRLQMLQAVVKFLETNNPP